MVTKAIEYLVPPRIIRLARSEGERERRVSNWVTTWDLEESIDVAIVGVPLVKGGLLPMGVDTTPDAVRKAMVYCTTYNPDLGTDIQSLKVRHVGDIGLHPTEVLENHRRIEAAATEIFELTRNIMTIVVGGDGSITIPIVKALCKATSQKFGIIQFDSRVDSRDVAESGPSDATPTRAILEANIGVSGNNVVHIGSHGFLTAKEEEEWALNRGVTVVTARQVRREGIEAVTHRALGTASAGTDGIYVSLDGSALDIIASSSTLASAPGGVSLTDLQESLFLLGQDPNVKVLDLVGIDTYNDIKEVVGRTTVGLLLSFLAGVKNRT